MNANIEIRVDETRLDPDVFHTLSEYLPEVADNVEAVEAYATRTAAEREAASIARQDALAEFRDAKGEVVRATDPSRDRRYLTDEELELDIAQAKSGEERAKRKADATDVQLKDVAQRWGGSRRMRRQSQHYLNHIGSGAITMAVQVAKPVKIKGDPFALYDQKLAEVKNIRNAPPSKDDVHERLVAQVSAKAAEAVVTVVGRGNRAALSFPKMSVAAEPRTYDGVPYAHDPAPWICRFFRDEVVADIDRQLDEQYRDIPIAMSAAERRTQLAQAEAELLELDRARCAVIWERFRSGESDRLDFPRDADIRAVLQIEGPPPEPIED